MENRITVSICDEEYTFVAEEAPSYMQKVGSYVNDKMSELLDSAKVGRTDAAVLTAVNITDELFKEREAGDALRRQLDAAGCPQRAELPFHKLLLDGTLPLTMGGGIGQSRLCMLLLGKAHVGEVQVSLWDDATVQACRNSGVELL